MKNAFKVIAPLLAIACIFVLFAMHSRPKSYLPPINSVIGDISYIQTYGKAPEASTDEDLRIRTHLAYVEAYLRTADTRGLTPELRARRAAALDHLHDYWTAGIFPRNYDHPGTRKPCFIDRDGRICAVGYLVEQSAGREAAEAINEQHQYERLLAMNDAALDEWIASSGLTKTECAMIQPQYGWPYPPLSPLRDNNHVSHGSAISSSGFIGLNATLVGINGMQILRGAKGKAVPIMSMVSGAGQIVLGIATLPEPHYNSHYDVQMDNNSQRQLSMANIGLGTASVALGVVNLLHNRPGKQPRLSWNVQGYQNGMGVGFTRMF